jgi:hypothetical protein
VSLQGGNVHDVLNELHIGASNGVNGVNGYAGSPARSPAREVSPVRAPSPVKEVKTASPIRPQSPSKEVNRPISPEYQPKATPSVSSIDPISDNMSHMSLEVNTTGTNSVRVFFIN